MEKQHPGLELSSTQYETLAAICDTFLAQLSSTEEERIQKKIHHSGVVYEASTDQVKELANYSASSLHVPDNVIEFLSNTVDTKKRADLIRVLNLLGTKSGSLLLTGYFSPLSKLSRLEREQVMLNWRTSKFQAFRTMFASFSLLTLFNSYKVTNSPLGKCIGYDSAHGDQFFETHQDYNPIEHPRIPMMSTAEATRHNLEFDVIVVGSGAGGGVAAAELSLAGHSVLVIEKGRYYHQSEMVIEEEKAYINMYDGGGSPFTAENGSVYCLAGSTLGGGTALNYLVSLKVYNNNNTL